MKINNLKL